MWHVGKNSWSAVGVHGIRGARMGRVPRRERQVARGVLVFRKSRALCFGAPHERRERKGIRKREKRIVYTTGCECHAGGVDEPHWVDGRPLAYNQGCVDVPPEERRRGFAGGQTRSDAAHTDRRRSITAHWTCGSTTSTTRKVPRRHLTTMTGESRAYDGQAPVWRTGKNGDTVHA